MLAGETTVAGREEGFDVAGLTVGMVPSERRHRVSPLVERWRGSYSYIFEGDGRYTFKMEHSQDGKEWCSFMDGRYTRK